MVLVSLLLIAFETVKLVSPRFDGSLLCPLFGPDMHLPFFPASISPTMAIRTYPSTCPPFLEVFLFPFLRHHQDLNRETNFIPCRWRKLTN